MTTLPKEMFIGYLPEDKDYRGESYFTLPEPSSCDELKIDTKYIRFDIHQALQTQTEWRPFGEWCEDYGDCLFAFWDYEFKEYNLVFTSPLDSEWEDYFDDGVECLYFLKVKDLPEPPQTKKS